MTLELQAFGEHIMAKIFVATTGRSGSMFLTEMMRVLTDIPSFHEEVPFCIGQTSYEINNNCISETTQRVLDAKMKQIDKNSNSIGDYFEANNMFIKSFAWETLKSFEDVYCIYLHRNPADVFFSLGNRNWRKGYDWLLRPQWERSVIKVDYSTTYYEDLMLMWYEVKARFEQLKPRFKKTWDFNFKDLNNLDEYYRMLEHFEIPHKKTTRDVLAELKRNVGGDKETIEETLLRFRNGWERVKGVEWAYTTDVDTMKQVGILF